MAGCLWYKKGTSRIQILGLRCADMGVDMKKGWVKFTDLPAEDYCVSETPLVGRELYFDPQEYLLLFGMEAHFNLPQLRNLVLASA